MQGVSEPEEAQHLVELLLVLDVCGEQHAGVDRPAVDRAAELAHLPPAAEDGRVEEGEDEGHEGGAQPEEGVAVVEDVVELWGLPVGLELRLGLG